MSETALLAKVGRLLRDNPFIFFHIKMVCCASITASGVAGVRSQVVTAIRPAGIFFVSTLMDCPSRPRVLFRHEVRRNFCWSLHGSFALSQGYRAAAFRQFPTKTTERH